jgi:acyl dehydratase
LAKQLFYEDVEVNLEIPTLVKHPSTVQLVKWAGAAEEFNPIHYDKDFALSHNLPGLIVHGPLQFNFLGQMITDWIGDQGILRKLECSHRGMAFPGEALSCKGRIVKKYVQGNDHYVECEVWVENPRGEKTVPATALIILPSRS